MRIMRERIIGALTAWILAVLFGLMPALAQDIGGSAVSNPPSTDAADLTGELDDARLSTNVPLLSAENVYTASPQTVNHENDPYFRLQIDGQNVGYFEASSGTNTVMLVAADSGYSSGLWTNGYTHNLQLLPSGALTVDGSEVVGTVKEKSADEENSSCAGTVNDVVADPDLSGWSLDASSTYQVDGTLIWHVGTVAPSMKWASSAAVTSLYIAATSIGATGVVDGDISTGANSLDLMGLPASTDAVSTIAGRIVTSGSTTVDFAWCATVASTLRAGSFLRFRKL